MQNLKFHQNVQIFEIEDVKMVGDLVSGRCICLDEEGEYFTRYFLGDHSGQVNMDELSANQAQLLEDFIDSSFFYKEDTSFKSAYVHVTDRFTLETLDTLDILDCLESHLHTFSDAYKTDLDLGEIWNALFQLKDLGVQRIVFSGGDPFVRSDFDLICKMAKDELGISHVSVITTGLLPKAHYTKCLPFLDDVTVLIDGYQHAYSGSTTGEILAAVSEGIDWLKNRVKVNLMVNLNQRTIHSIKDYQTLARTTDLGLSYRILCDSPEEDSFKRHLFSGDGLDKAHSTRANPEVISISAHGAIYPCLKVNDETLSIGNILHTPIEMAIQSLRSPY
jgi:organic radical activating enzyme